MTNSLVLSVALSNLPNRQLNDGLTIFHYTHLSNFDIDKLYLDYRYTLYKAMIQF